MTPLKTMISKFSNKTSILALAFFLFSVVTFAQKKQKVDGVAAVVGNYIVLDSDIDLMYLELKSQGIDVEKITRCELLGKQLEDKLYAHQAIQDSIVVTDEEINTFMDNQMNTMVEQIGSKEKLFEYYKKKDEEDFRSYFFEIIKMNKLTQQMQRKIVDDITVTPDEVKQFFNKIPADQVPIIGAEIELSQIVVKPVVTKEDKQKVIDKLNEIRNDVLNNGASFYSKAVIYSEDEASISSGGYYKINKKTQFVKEFKDVAFRLNEGEISEPFETEFGYHIIFVEKIIGQEIELRHIVMSPKVSSKATSDALEEIENIKAKIEKGEITFEDAAKASSDDKDTKTNGGLLLNPRTSEPLFEISKLDPALYNQVKDLKQGEVSKVFLDQERKGAKFFKILKVNKKTEEHKADYGTDYMKIKELALSDKQFNEVIKWRTENIEKNYIKVNNEYKDCAFESNWLKK
ncbi:peptidylprolyl isomerase [Flavobacterium terrigena]|uniref:Periplasmic chaperone for outer membrane proteins SurA n=1 Tax=Flavobacterium terrigena TaxID=402734 RepID=A0A1H6S1B6_9FLAO|nr:peptidylprolyl isomerase [Flavobacterium terrigena]SEI58567.1 periplasmic chaperone for outer membrane proteins SurA [Flavobacterium terrigena]